MSPVGEIMVGLCALLLIEAFFAPIASIIGAWRSGLEDNDEEED